tara:strand:- start:703 stop:1443 length:741 start_codon:yes stop_codon:yes gene_type:complete
MTVIDNVKNFFSASPLPRLLVVDDDERLRALLKKFLTENGFQVETACHAAQAREKLTQGTYDLMVLDVMMPGESGIEFTESLRDSGADGHNKALPILMLTALGEGEERVEGLECGADDYLAKPFEPKELVLRIEKLIERAQPRFIDITKDLHFGSLSYCLTSQTLKNAQKEIVHLTSAESGLLSLFAQRPREALSRDELADNSGVSLSPRTVDVQITRLRKKIESDPRQPKYLRTVRHKGYALWPD